MDKIEQGGVNVIVGRKLFDGKDVSEVLSKLEKVFALGGSDEEACFYADISVSALHRYQSRHARFRERKNLLRQKPILRAREEVVKGIESSPEFAFKFLERKKKDEFGKESDMHLQLTEECQACKSREEVIRRGNQKIDPSTIKPSVLKRVIEYKRQKELALITGDQLPK